MAINYKSAVSYLILTQVLHFFFEGFPNVVSFLLKLNFQFLPAEIRNLQVLVKDEFLLTF